MLTTEQFDRTRRLALSLAGIELVERHRELLDRRGRRRGILDGAGLDSLLDAAEEGEPTARQQLLCLLTTKFTGFFRHPRHFDLAAKRALRAAQCRGQARLWSAAAATGEEPYSLAMALMELFQSDHPPASILATDIDVEALAVGQQGEYGEAALRALDPERRARFFSWDPRVEGSRERGVYAASAREQNDSFDGDRTPPLPCEMKRRERRAPRLAARGTAASTASSTAAFPFRETRVARPWSIVPAARRLVQFRPLNLAGAGWAIAGPFDVIFCRNVLMYLESYHRGTVLERMASLLAPDGMLVLDPTEHPGKAGHLFTAGADGVYSPRRASFPERIP